MENEKTHSHKHHPGHRRRSTHGSSLLRFLLVLLRILILLCSLYILGLFIWRYVRRSKSGSTLAILILAAISSAWAFLSLFTTCLGHSRVASFNFLVDVVHVGAMIAVAVLLRDYAGNSCGGTGTQRRDCRLLKAAFGIAVGLCALYALTAILSLLLIAAFRRARPYGPSPDNDYTDSGYNRPPKRRGFITPDLATGRDEFEHGYRTSTYTNNSAGTEANPGLREGTLHGRDTGDSAGLLPAPAPAAGHEYDRHTGPRAASSRYKSSNPPAAGSYEPYRAPTPLGGTRNGESANVEMPGERDYGGSLERGGWY